MVSVLPVAAAIVPPNPLIEITFEMVPVVFANNIPLAPIVTVPVERCVPLDPPEATDKIPPEIVVVPL